MLGAKQDKSCLPGKGSTTAETPPEGEWSATGTWWLTSLPIVSTETKTGGRSLLWLILKASSRSVLFRLLGGHGGQPGPAVHPMLQLYLNGA